MLSPIFPLLNAVRRRPVHLELVRIQIVPQDNVVKGKVDTDSFSFVILTQPGLFEQKDQH